MRKRIRKTTPSGRKDNEKGKPGHTQKKCLDKEIK